MRLNCSYIITYKGNNRTEKLYTVFHFTRYGRLSRESMILLKNFSNKSCLAWRGTYDGNMDLTLSNLAKSD